MTHALVARCSGCGSASETASYDPVELRCPKGHRFQATWPTHGEVRTAELGWRSLLRGDWSAAYRERAAGGPLVAEACPRCARVVTLPLDTPLCFGCEHCGARTEVPAEDGVLDILFESSAPKPMWSFWASKVAIGPFVHRGSSAGLSCPSCGADTPDVDGRAECPHCHTTLVAWTSCGRRFVPGLRVVGHHEGTDLDGWMPVAEGLDYFERYKRYVRRSPLATLVSLIGLAISLFILVVVFIGFVSGAVGMVVFSELAAFTGWGFFDSLTGFFAAGTVSSWAVGFVSIGSFGIVNIAGPILANLWIRRRLGLQRAPDVRPISPP